jgi:hypothetical protein
MRTTLTIEPPVAERIRRRMEDNDQTLKAVINEALRAGLRALEAEALRPSRKRFVMKAHNFGGVRPGIDRERILRLAEELADQDLVVKLRAR